MSLLPQSLQGGGVLPQVRLRPNQNEGSAAGVVLDLRKPLGPYIVEGGAGGDGEAHQKHVCLGVRQRSQSIIILLTGCIPQTKVDWLVVHHHIRTIVIEHSWNILSREGVGGIRDQ